MAPLFQTNRSMGALWAFFYTVSMIRSFPRQTLAFFLAICISSEASGISQNGAIRLSMADNNPKTLAIVGADAILPPAASAMHAIFGAATWTFRQLAKANKHIDDFHDRLPFLPMIPFFGTVILPNGHNVSPVKTMSAETLLTHLLRQPFRHIISDLGGVFAFRSGDDLRRPKTIPLEIAHRITALIKKNVGFTIVSSKNIQTTERIWINSQPAGLLSNQRVYTHSGAQGHELTADGRIPHEPFHVAPLFDGLKEDESVMSEKLTEILIESARRIALTHELPEPFPSFEVIPVGRKPIVELVLHSDTGFTRRFWFEVGQEIRKFLMTNCPRLYVVSDDRAVRLTRVSKGSAIMREIPRLGTRGISQKEILVIGNSREDFPMYKAAPDTARLHVGYQTNGLPDGVWALGKEWPPGPDLMKSVLDLLLLAWDSRRILGILVLVGGLLGSMNYAGIFSIHRNPNVLTTSA
jgi:hypothetical protein